MNNDKSNLTNSYHTHNSDGGAIIGDNVDTNGGNFVGRDNIVVNIASGANNSISTIIVFFLFSSVSIFTIIVFILLITDLPFNLINRFTNFSVTGLQITAGVMAIMAWSLSIWIQQSKYFIGKSNNRARRKQRYNFTGRYRAIARFIALSVLLLSIITCLTYAVWRYLPARQTTILVADFVTASGTDEARVTEILVNEISNELTDFDDIRVMRLNRVIELENGSEKAVRIGQQIRHKATVVIWGNYAIVAGDPEIHVHFDIVQPTNILSKVGFDASYGPIQISQMLQIDQPTMFDFKTSLGEYLGQMSAFTVGLTLFEAYRHKEAALLFETAGEAIGQPMAAELERAIRLYRGTNYGYLGRTKDAEPDLQALIPDITGGHTNIDSIALAALNNLGNVVFFHGNYEAALNYYKLSLEIDKLLSNPHGQARSLGNLGNVAFFQGNSEEAGRYYKQALEIDTQLGNLRGQASALGNLGSMALSQGNYAVARRHLEDSLKIHTQIDNLLGQAADIGNLGLVEMNQGDYETARRYLENAQEIYIQLGNPRGQAIQLGNLGHLYLELKDFDTARENYELSAELYRSMALDTPTAILDGLEGLDRK